MKEGNDMRAFGFDSDDLRKARARGDDPYVSYKEVIVQVPDIAAYRAAVDRKLTAYGLNKLVDAPVIIEMDSSSD
jgi:hypothetical protein